MSQEQPARPLRAIVPFVITDGPGSPCLRGNRCNSCGQIFLERPHQCARCFATDMSVTALSTRGTLYNYTIVHRSMPSVEVPFISAIIDLDGGGSVKTNLKGIAPSPDGIPFGMPVEIKFEELDWRDDEGNRYLSFHAVPAPEETIDEQ